VLFGAHGAGVVSLLGMMWEWFRAFLVSPVPRVMPRCLLQAETFAVGDGSGDRPPPARVPRFGASSPSGSNPLSRFFPVLGAPFWLRFLAALCVLAGGGTYWTRSAGGFD